MFAIKENNLNCFCLVVFISIICSANARQIRYNRYNTEAIEDIVENQNSTYATEAETEDEENGIEATVREIKLIPYPASGIRPSKAFPLPNEASAKKREGDTEAQVTDESTITSTAETIGFTTTTHGYENESTTTSNVGERAEIVEDISAESEKTSTPYPPAGFKPKIPFLLPINKNFNSEQQQQEYGNKPSKSNEVNNDRPNEVEVKAPYPAAGYRPSKVFLLPSEQLQLKDESKEDMNSIKDNSNHPVCGSSTNPLSPKPVDGEEVDPDSESININSKMQKRS